MLNRLISVIGLALGTLITSACPTSHPVPPTPVTHSVLLTWNQESVQFDFYNVYRSSDCTNYSVIAQVPVNTYLDQKVNTGNVCYAVTAVSNGQESNKSIPWQTVIQ